MSDAKIRAVCVYCGSQPGNHPAFQEAAREIGQGLATEGIGLVYGGGGSGIMGEIARAVKAGGGTVTGVIPEFLISKERGNGDGELGEMIVTRDMHERKTAMFDRADAFIALPGGIGTLEEVIEMMTWAQLGRHEKPIIFANIEGFWNPLLDLLAHMAEAGFIHTSAKLNPIVVNDARKILAVLKNADQR